MSAQLMNVVKVAIALLLYPVLVGLMLHPGLAMRSIRWTVAYVVGAIAFLGSFAWLADRIEEASRLTDLPPALASYFIGLAASTLVLMLSRANR